MALFFIGLFIGFYLGMFLATALTLASRGDADY